MVCETTSGPRSPLLPDRHPQPDFFICDVLDAVPKDDIGSMEHPVFSLSTKPDRRSRRYEHKGNVIEIIPSEKGLATIHDKDILIYCISQLMAKKNRGEPISRNLVLKAHNLLVMTNRRTDGPGYLALAEAATRLQGTLIQTTIPTGAQRIRNSWPLLGEWTIVEELESGRMSRVEVEIPKWIFNAVQADEVLTLHKDYFRLRKPLERRLYEIARKACGRNGAAKRLSLETLKTKTGSISTMKEFRRLLGSICDQDETHGHMPDYAFRLEDDAILVERRSDWIKGEVTGEDLPVFAHEHVTLMDVEDIARKSGLDADVDELRREWLQWWEKKGRKPLKSPDRAFIRFVERKADQMRAAQRTLF